MFFWLVMGTFGKNANIFYLKTGWKRDPAEDTFALPSSGGSPGSVRQCSIDFIFKKTCKNSQKMAVGQKIFK